VQISSCFVVAILYWKVLRECIYLPSEFFIITMVRKFWSVFYPHICRSAFYTLLQQQCSGTDILRVTPVTFLYISHKPPLRSWTWLSWLNFFFKKMWTWCRHRGVYTCVRNFRLSWVELSISSESQWDSLSAYRLTDTQMKWKQYILGGYNKRIDNLLTKGYRNNKLPGPGVCLTSGFQAFSER